MTANYYGMISLIDHSVGRILTALHQSGLDERTLVVYSTDHGDLLGDHGLYLKGPTPYEALLRVGLLMRGPGIPAGRVVADPVSTLDLAATFADVAGTTLGEAAQSRSLLPVIAGEESREVAYSEWYVNESRCGVPLELHTVRGQGWKCTVEKRSGAGELYDLREDPDEMRNLFDDPAGAALRRQAEALIEARPGTRRAEKLPVVGMA
jgi:arylsulfatase A-like enzyme